MDGKDLGYIDKRNKIRSERQIKRVKQQEENEGQLRVKLRVCVRGKQVLTPQSVRVRMEGDRECSKGEDEESSLKRRREIR